MTYTLKNEVFSIPELFEEVFWRLESDVRLMIPTQEVLNFRNIFITGSGDSYMAGLTAELAFLELAKIPTRAYQSLTYSRYYLDCDIRYPEKDNLSIAISNSGTAARVIEAQTKAYNLGYKTVAVSSLGTPLSEVSDYVYNSQSEKKGFAPGVRSFSVMQMALYLMAIRFGEVKANYPMEQAAYYRNLLFNSKNFMIDDLERNNSKFKTFAHIIDKFENVEVLASGSHKGVSEFFAATVIEAVGYQASSQDIEEFGHINFFRNNPSEIPTVVILPSDSRGKGRGLEIIDALKSLGRPYLIITDRNLDEIEESDLVIKLQTDLTEIFSSLNFGVAVAYLTSFLGDDKKLDYFRNHEGVYDESKILRPSESKIEI